MLQLNYAQVCHYWLNQLRGSCGLEPLLGSPSPMVREMAELYGAVPMPPAYGAEVRLQGGAGLDLSVQYPAAMFALPEDQPVWPDGKLTRQRDIFRRYATFQQQLAPEILAASKVYLEADTLSGGTSSSCFFDTDELVAKKMLQALDAGSPKEPAPFTARQLDALRIIWDLMKKQLRLHRCGFMLGREQQPLRLELYARQDKLDGLLQGMALVVSPPGAAVDLLQKIDALGLFRFMLTVDLLPDGQLGPSFGFELFLPTQEPKQQSQLLQSSIFSQFISTLQTYGLADKRAELLSFCCAEDHHGIPGCNIYSLLSHMKLTWTEGTPQPAKAYLGLRIEPQQSSINESLHLFSY